MIQTLLLLILSIMGNKLDSRELFDLQRLDSAHHYYMEEWQFENGSFTRVINGESYRGCIPFKLCSDIQTASDMLDLLD